MKMSRVLLDFGIPLMALPLAAGVVWAGNNNAIDVILTGILLMVPMVSLFLLARNWPKPETDKYY